MRSDVDTIRALPLLLGLLMLAGCSGYAIEGRVVRGPSPSVMVVDSDDPRLTELNTTGSGAAIEGVLEPNTPTERQTLGRFVADEQGWFAIPVDAIGSGLLEYEALLIARRDGNQGAMGTIELPRRGQRVLITLPLGADTLIVPESFRDQALRDARPYLDDNR